MKKLLITVTIIAALFLGVSMFFSCALDTGEYGTLLVQLPGSGSRGIVPDDYMAKLYYRVVCVGAYTITRDFSAGGTAAIALPGGDWAVSVTVHINGSPKTIGRSDTKLIAVEVGKTSTAKLDIVIEDNHCDITSFSINGFPGHKIEIVDDETLGVGGPAIFIRVPHGTIPGNAVTIPVSVTHEGRYYETSNYPDSTITVGSYPDPSITVTALNQDYEKVYDIFLEELPYGDWPFSAVWASYGLGGLSQPAGTTVFEPYEVNNGELYVMLVNASMNSVNSLKSAIKARPGISVINETEFGTEGYNYDLDYKYSGKNYSLGLIFLQNGIPGFGGTLHINVSLTEQPDSPIWPAIIWPTFGIMNFPQPAGSNLVSVSFSSEECTVEMEEDIETLRSLDNFFDDITNVLNVNFNVSFNDSGDGYRITNFIGKGGTASFNVYAYLTLARDAGTVTITLSRSPLSPKL